MPIQSFTISYKVNSNRVLSPSELKDIYLYGIDIKDQHGTTLSDEALEYYIDVAQKEIEQYLTLKLQKQVIEESKDFVWDDWVNWNYVRGTYPIKEPIGLEGFLNTTKQITYPKEWLTVRKTNDGETYFRNMYIVPVGSSSTVSMGNIVYTGISPQIGFFGSRHVPHYWTLKYITGFDKIPLDIVDVIGKFASIKVLNVAGDIALGAAALASQSLSIDGLSQSLTTTMSAENSAYSARIKQYIEELVGKLGLLRQLKDKYLGYTFTVA